MLTIQKSISYAALAALIGLGGAVAGTAPAAAATYRTDCYGDQCTRLRCDDFGNYCVQVTRRNDNTYNRFDARYRHDTSRHDTRYDCDQDGNNCRSDHPGYYDADGDWHDGSQY